MLYDVAFLEDLLVLTVGQTKIQVAVWGFQRLQHASKSRALDTVKTVELKQRLGNGWDSRFWWPDFDGPDSDKCYIVFSRSLVKVWLLEAVLARPKKLPPLEGSCTTRHVAKDPTLLPADHHPVLGVVEKHFATIERVGTPSDSSLTEKNRWGTTGNQLNLQVCIHHTHYEDQPGFRAIWAKPGVIKNRDGHERFNRENDDSPRDFGLRTQCFSVTFGCLNKLLLIGTFFKA